MFHRGELRFWAITKGHNADVGGGGVVGYNPYARDVWEDVLRIPPVRVIHKGELQREVRELILLNIPLRALVESDFERQSGAANVGARALQALLDSFGVEATSRAISYFIDASRREMESLLVHIPDGVYSAVRHIDDGQRAGGPGEARDRCDVDHPQVGLYGSLEQDEPRPANLLRYPFEILEVEKLRFHAEGRTTAQILSRSTILYDFSFWLQNLSGGVGQSPHPPDQSKTPKSTNYTVNQQMTCLIRKLIL